MAPHSSTFAWKIPWMEEPGGLQFMGSRRFGHDWATSLSLFTFMHWRRKWQPTPVFLSGESRSMLQSMGLHRLGHDWSNLAALIISFSNLYTSRHYCNFFIQTMFVWIVQHFFLFYFYDCFCFLLKMAFRFLEVLREQIFWQYASSFFKRQMPFLEYILHRV